MLALRRRHTRGAPLASVPYSAKLDASVIIPIEDSVRRWSVMFTASDCVTSCRWTITALIALA